MRGESPTMLAEFVDLLEKVAAVPVDPAVVGRHTLLADDLALDSISLIALMALSEERFRIDLAEHAESIAQIRSVGDALDLIESLVPAQDSSPNRGVGQIDGAEEGRGDLVVANGNAKVLLETSD